MESFEIKITCNVMIILPWQPQCPGWCLVTHWGTTSTPHWGCLDCLESYRLNSYGPPPTTHHHTPIRHNNVSFWFLYLSTYRLEKHNQDTLRGRYSIHVWINKLSFLMTDVRKILFTVTASNNILLCYCFLSCICWVTRRRVCLKVFAGFKSKKLLESNEMLSSFFK